MAQYHQLDSSNKINIKCNNKNIERVKEYKLLGIILDEHFKLHSHANKLLKDFKTLCTILPRETTLRVTTIIKVRLLHYFVQNITAISKK